MNDFRVKVKDMIILFQKWGNYKRPVIAVRFEGEKHIYKIATFSSEDTAKWFVECLEERIKRDLIEPHVSCVMGEDKSGWTA